LGGVSRVLGGRGKVSGRFKMFWEVFSGFGMASGGFRKLCEALRGVDGLEKGF